MNHDIHENDEIHEIATYRMRVTSPLGPEEERFMTESIGCAVAVHKALGPGFLESIYRKAMCIEWESRGGLLINFRVPILPKGLERIVV
jgi:hypothetical protein